MAVEAARLMVRVGYDGREAEQGVKSFGAKLASASKTMAITGGALTAGVTLPLLGIAKAGLSSAADFEQSMNILQQVSGASASAMADLQAQALELGAETSFSAGEAAEGMLELAKAGMDTQKVMKAIPGVMSLAAAGGVSLGEAAGLTAATLNAFGLEAEQSTMVADLLAATANASAADISDLGAGMRQAGFAFSMANQPVENLAASLAILTNVGLTGSDAGTALKNAFMRMMNPTEEAKGIMDELGISFYDAQGNMKGLPDIIETLNSAMSGLSSQQRDAALATMFLSDGMKAFIPLMDAGKEGFDETVTAVTEAGAASDVAGARMKGLSGGIEYLSGSVDSFLIGAALPFLDTLGGLARGAGDALTAFSGLPPSVINATLAFLGVLAVAGPVVAGLGAIGLALGSLAWPILGVVVGVALLAAAWASNLGDIQGKTGTVFTAVQEWFSSTGTAATTLATSLSTAFANTKFPTLETLWSQFKAGDFQKLASTMRSTAYELMVNLDTELNITAKADDLKNKLVSAVNALTTAAGNIDFSGATAGFSKLTTTVQDSLTTAFANIDLSGARAGFSKLTANIQSELTTAISGIDFAAMRSNLSTVLDNFGVDTTPLQTALSSVKTGLMDLVSAAKGFDLGAAVTNVQIKLGEVRDGILGGLTSAIEGVDWAGGGQTFAGMVNSLSAGIKNLDFNSINWTEIIGPRLLGPLGSALRGIQWVMDSEQFGGLASAVSTAIGSINWGELSSAFVGLGAAIVSEVGAVASDIVKDMVTGVTDALNNVDWSAASIDFAGMMSSWTEQINSTDWSGIGSSFVTKTHAAIQNAFSGVTVEGDTLANRLDEAFNNMIANIKWNEIGKAGGGLALAIGDAIGGVVQGINTELETLPKLAWADYVDNVVWKNFVGAIQWSTYVSSVAWSEFLSDLQWGSYVLSLSWNEFIAGITWSSFIPSLSWSDWVDDLSWSGFVDDLAWGDWISRVNWGDWLGGLLGGGGASSAPAAGGGGFNASGTSFWRGGPTWVGERGPELVDLPMGARIFNNTDSERMAASAGGINITINANVGSGLDAEAVALDVVQRIRRHMRI